MSDDKAADFFQTSKFLHFKQILSYSLLTIDKKQLKISLLFLFFHGSVAVAVYESSLPFTRGC